MLLCAAGCDDPREAEVCADVLCSAGQCVVQGVAAFFNDRDFLRLPAAAGTVVRIEVQSAGGPLRVEARDTRYRAPDWGGPCAITAPGDAAQPSVLACAVPAHSPLTLHVRTETWLAVAYTLAYAELGPDDFDVDAPAPLTPGTPLAGTLSTRDDADAFVWETSAGGTYGAGCAAEGFACGVEVGVTGCQAEFLRASADIRVRLPAGEPCRVRVEVAAPGEDFFTVEPYQVLLQALP